MKASALWLMLVLSLAVEMAQAQGFSASQTNKVPASGVSAADTSLESLGDINFGSSLDLKPAVTTPRITGPLLVPFTAPTLLEVPTRLWQLINPLAPVDTTAFVHKTVVPKLSARPWSTTVGWRPGISQFPDVNTHEPQMVLVSFHAR